MLRMAPVQRHPRQFIAFSSEREPHVWFWRVQREFKGDHLWWKLVQVCWRLRPARRRPCLLRFDWRHSMVYFCNLPRTCDQNEEHNPLESAVITKGINLTKQEERNLHDLLAMKKGYIGAFFVHRFTKSNIGGKTMVCFWFTSIFYFVCNFLCIFMERKFNDMLL